MKFDNLSPNELRLLKQALIDLQDKLYKQPLNQVDEADSVIVGSLYDRVKDCQGMTIWPPKDF